MNRYGFGPSDVARYLNKTHATSINSNNVVREQLEIKNVEYINEIIKWSEVFDEILPNGDITDIVIQERVEQLLVTLTRDRVQMISSLKELVKKLEVDTSDLHQVGVI